MGITIFTKRLIKNDAKNIKMKIRSDGYLDLSKTFRKNLQTVSEKMENLKMALKPYLSNNEFIELMKDETIPHKSYNLVQHLVPKLYRKDRTAGQKALELKIFLEDIAIPFYCEFYDADDDGYEDYATKELEWQEIICYDSYVKNFKSNINLTIENDYQNIFEYDKQFQKRIKRYEKKVKSENYLRQPKSSKEYHQSVLAKFVDLKKELQPYLTETGYQNLLNATAEDTLNLLDHLIVRLDFNNKVAADKAIELRVFIKEQLIEYERQVIYTLEKDYRKKIMAEGYLENFIESQDDEQEYLYLAINKKFNSLIIALKPYLSASDFEKLSHSDPISILEMFEYLIPMLFYQQPETDAVNHAIELRAFISYKIFEFAEHDLANNTTNPKPEASKKDEVKNNELTEEFAQDDLDSVAANLKEKSLYDSYIKEYDSSTDLYFEKNSERLLLAYLRLSDKTLKKYQKQYKSYIKTKTNTESRQIIIDKLLDLKNALKPYLTEVGFKELLNTNPVEISTLLNELAMRLYQKDVTAAIAIFELQAFIETVVYDFAERDMHVTECRKKVMAEDYLGNYELYSSAITKKMRELKTALKPYLHEDEFQKLLVATPYGTLSILRHLIARLYYDEQNISATATAIELKTFIECRIVNFSYT